MYKTKSYITCLAAAFAVAVVTGCAGYRVGSMLPGDIKNVYIPTFENRTSEPLIEVDVMQAVIRQFQQDGSMKITSEADADAVLNVVLTSYKLEPVSYRKDVRTAAEQYRMYITAKIDMRRTKDNSVVVESPRVIGKYVFDVNGDLSSSKLEATPQTADDFAKNLVQMLVEYW